MKHIIFARRYHAMPMVYRSSKQQPEVRLCGIITTSSFMIAVVCTLLATGGLNHIFFRRSRHYSATHTVVDGV